MLTHTTFTNTPDIRAAAPGGSGAGNPAPTPFWKRDQKASLAGRINAINQINDPTIMTDNVLRWVKVILVVLLAATGLIGALNYYKFFSISMSNFYIVAFLTLAIAGIVEFGKYFATKWAIRNAFFVGFRHIFAEAHSTLIFLGLAVVSVLTFALSAYNSTKGAEQLAYLISHESAEGKAVFTPNTPDLDAQIAAAQGVQSSALSNRITTGQYKGMVDWQSSKTAKSAGQTAASLIAQKETVVAQQRADWERQQAERARSIDHAAGFTLKIGGWLELLQCILMFIRVACEKQLASHPDAQPRRQQSPNPTPSPSFNGQHSFNGSFPNNSHPTNSPLHHTFFNRGADGNVRTASADPLPTLATSLATDNEPAATERMINAEKILRYHRDQFQKWASHLNRRDAPGTHDTIVGMMKGAHADIEKMGYGIDPEEVEKFCQYIERNLAPRLEEKGPGYAGTGVMLATLRGKARRDTHRPSIAEVVLSKYSQGEGAQV